MHAAFSHLEKPNKYIRMLFGDYSSAFNTIVPSQLINKLHVLGLTPSICNWLLDFFTNRSQSVRLDMYTSSTLTLSTGVPQGCVLSPLLYALFTHDYQATHDSNILIKFADDTTVIGLIKDNNEVAYVTDVCQ